MVDTVPEGGWGWCVVASAHVAHMMWDGDSKALAVLLPTLRQQFTTHTWVIGWIIASMTTVISLTGPVAGAISENTHLDARYIGILGGVLTSFGFIAASYSSNVLELTIFVSILGGIGLGLSLIESTSLVSHYFDRLYPRASGIMTCGTAIGMLVFAPLSQMLLDTYGWRGVLLLIGGINLHLIFFGSLLRPVDGVSAPRYSSIDSNVNHTTTNFLNTYSKIKNFVAQALPSDLFKDPIYILHLLAYCNCSFTFTGWIIYLVPHAIEKGLSPYQAATISSVAAGISVIGRLGYVPLVERNVVTIRFLLYTAVSLSAVVLLIDPWMNTMWSVMLTSSAYLFGKGMFKSIFFVILKGNLGADRLASGLGWSLAIGGILRPISGIIVGWIYDYTRSYDLGFILLGIVDIFTLVFLTIEDIYRKKQLEAIKK